ncbi:Thiamine monophosphate synthase [Rhodospirillaceae bacterium LM-1]|nr:Thiamine monophosphate synthase [Rhodospirillaceae bacterium LM-1]
MSITWTDAGLVGPASGDFSKPVFVLMTDSRLANPLSAAAKLQRGSWVILRFQVGEALPSYAVPLRRLCRQRGLEFLVAGDHRLAAKLRADGLHLSERHARTFCLSTALSWIGGKRPRRWLSVAAHSSRGLAQAARIKANVAILSPVFPTRSHPEVKPLGLCKFQNLSKSARLPVIALGGVSRQTAKRLTQAKLVGLAGISAFTA